MTVEVFRTDVANERDAGMLIDRIHSTFSGYRANFDLTDCDRILRVASQGRSVSASAIVRLLQRWGFHAEVLPDEIPQLFQS